jgi:hypothetical protein
MTRAIEAKALSDLENSFGGKVQYANNLECRINTSAIISKTSAIFTYLFLFTLNCFRACQREEPKQFINGRVVQTPCEPK